MNLDIEWKFFLAFCNLITLFGYLYYNKNKIIKIMNNKEWKFWLTFCNLITLLEIFFFMLFCVFRPTFTFHKEYCLVLIPNLLYIGFQFILNYVDLTSEYKNESECKK